MFTAISSYECSFSRFWVSLFNSVDANNLYIWHTAIHEGAVLVAEDWEEVEKEEDSQGLIAAEAWAPS